MKTPAQKIAQHLAAALIKDERGGMPNHTIVRTHDNDADLSGTTNTSNLDTYDALQHATPDSRHPRPRYLSVSCTGWASPTDGTDIAPSLHHQRQRVALVLVLDITTDSLTTTLRFADRKKRGQTGTDNDAGQGALADAIREAGRAFRE